MLRLIAAGLVLANLLFFGWVQGWLAPAIQPPRHAEHEPQRLAAQVRPETVAVRPSAQLRSGAAPADGAADGTTGATACLQSGPLPAAEVADAESVLGAEQLPGVRWSRVPADGTGGRVLLRVLDADAALRSRLLALPGTALGGGFRPCDS